jgi:hypothetical protein
MLRLRREEKPNRRRTKEKQFHLKGKRGKAAKEGI